MHNGRVTGPICKRDEDAYGLRIYYNNCGPGMTTFVAYFDESGDHGLRSIDPAYPIFALCSLVFDVKTYCENEVPRILDLKFRYFGTDAIHFHSREIRKRIGPYNFSGDTQRREAFATDVGNLFDKCSATIIAGVIDKRRLQATYRYPANPYALSLQFCLERLCGWLKDRGSAGAHVSCIFEARGSMEDRDLELEFRRVCDGNNRWNERLNFTISFATKLQHVHGLEMADLAAYPIATHVLRPNGQNPAFDRVRALIRQSPQGKIEGWGLKVFP
jgi:hypothetical protein